MAPILHSELCVPGLGMELSVLRARMEAEFEHALREKIPLVLLRGDAEGLERLAPFRERQAHVLRALVELLAGLPRGGELIACREDAGILVLLPGTPLEAAELMCSLWIEGAKKLSLGESKPVRASLCIGLACAQSGSTYAFETLRRVALDGLAVASARGGECCVHSELYGLHQKSVERERPEVAALSGSSAPSTNAPPHAHDTDAAAPVGVPAPPPPSADRAARAAIERILAKHRPAHAAPFQPVEGEPLTAAHGPEPVADHAPDPLNDLLAVLDEKHKTEVSLLERRIAKLTRSLEETEDVLKRTALHGPHDPGISSAYRRVQGLALGEDNREQKLALLAQILRANLELRDQLRQAR